MTALDHSVLHSSDYQNVKLRQRPLTFLQLNQVSRRSQCILRSTVAGMSMVAAIPYPAVVVILGVGVGETAALLVIGAAVVVI